MGKINRQEYVVRQVWLSAKWKRVAAIQGSLFSECLFNPIGSAVRAQIV